MNTNESKVKKLLKTIVTAVADSGDDWPPKCSALLYQPIRPTVSKSEPQSNSNSKTEG